MAVRLRLKLKRVSSSEELNVIALLNSGYEADSPQLMIPIDIAKSLGLWPPQQLAREAIFETAGGPLRVWIIPRVVITEVICDVKSKEVLTDIVISPLADEPLISDILASELEIAVEDFGRGLWRFRWEPKEVVRESAKRI